MMAPNIDNAFDATPAPRPEIPRRLGTYALGARIGGGSYGDVYEAARYGTDSMVAIKLKHPLAPLHYWEEEVNLHRYLHERGVLHTPRFLERGEEGRWQWYSMERIDGDTITEIVFGANDKPHLVPRVMTAEELLKGVAAGVIDVLGVMAQEGGRHVHRDLSPHNILWRSKNQKVRAMVIDFGLTRDGRIPPTNPSGPSQGTPGFISPEQERKLPLTIASDLFSLGCVLACAATGRQAYNGLVDSRSGYSRLARALDALPAAKLLFSDGRSALEIVAGLSGHPYLDSQMPNEVLVLVAALLQEDPAARPRIDDIHGYLAALQAAGRWQQSDPGQVPGTVPYQPTGVDPQPMPPTPPYDFSAVPFVGNAAGRVRAFDVSGGGILTCGETADVPGGSLRWRPVPEQKGLASVTAANVSERTVGLGAITVSGEPKLLGYRQMRGEVQASFSLSRGLQPVSLLRMVKFWKRSRVCVIVGGGTHLSSYVWNGVSDPGVSTALPAAPASLVDLCGVGAVDDSTILLYGVDVDGTIHQTALHQGQWIPWKEWATVGQILGMIDGTRAQEAGPPALFIREPNDFIELVYRAPNGRLFSRKNDGRWAEEWEEIIPVGALAKHVVGVAPDGALAVRDGGLRLVSRSAAR